MDDYRMNDHLRAAERWLESRPVCDVCGQPIQESKMYEIENEDICPDCIMGWLRQFEIPIGD